MALVFFYVNAGSAAAEGVRGLWAERKAAAEKLRDSSDSGRPDNDNAPSRVAAPGSDNVLLAQLPSIDLNVLSNAIPKVQSQSQNLGALELGPGEKRGARPPDVPAAPLAARLPKAVKSVPMSFASLRDIYLPPNWKPGDLIVVNVQDAHGNAEAQRNIARIIESFVQEKIGTAPYFSGQAEANLGANTATNPGAKKLGAVPNLIVGIEGARGAFNFHPYRSFPDAAITKEIAQYLLKESFITGPEYVGMTLGLVPEQSVEAEDIFSAAAEARSAGAQPPVTFWGIEREDLYLEHVRAFKDSAAEQKGAEEKYRALSELMAKVKGRSLNPLLRELDAKMALHRKQQIGLGAYIKFLTGAARQPSGSPMIALLLRALTIEEAMDYKKVERERRELTSALTQKLPRSELKNLVGASLSYRLGHLTHTAFYQYLKQLCQAYGLALSQWPAMDQYIQYVLISERIQPDPLFKEIEALEQNALKAAVKTADEKAVIELSQDLALVEKLVSFGLSPQEWAVYESRKALIDSIPERLEKYSAEIGRGAKSEDVSPADLFKLLSKFEAFNRAAIARNEVLVQNLLAKVSEGNGGELALMVTGGFHTDGVTKLLKEKQVAYAVLMPRLGKVDGDGTEYLDIFSRDKTPLEKLFTGERITLAYPSNMATPMGEPAPVTFVVERNFALLGAAKLAAGILQQYPGLDADVQDQIESAIKAWVDQMGNSGFMTLDDVGRMEVQESRNRRGQLDKLVMTVTLEGRESYPSSSIAIEFLPKGSEAQPGIDGAEGAPIPITLNGDKIGLYTARIGAVTSILARLSRFSQSAKTAYAFAADRIGFNSQSLSNLRQALRSESGQSGAQFAFGLSVGALGLALTYAFSGGVIGALLSAAAGIAAMVGAAYFQPAPTSLDALDALIADIAREKTESAESDRRMWERVMKEFLPQWESYFNGDLNTIEYAELSKSVMRLPAQLGPEFREYLKAVVEYKNYAASPLGDQDDLREARFDALNGWIESDLIPNGLYVYTNYSRKVSDGESGQGKLEQDDNGPYVNFVPLKIAEKILVARTDKGGVTLLHSALLNPSDIQRGIPIPAGFVLPGQMSRNFREKNIYVIAIEEASRELAASTLEPFFSRPGGREQVAEWLGDEVMKYFPGISRDEIDKEHIEQLMMLAVWIHESRHGVDSLTGSATLGSRHMNEVSAYLAEIAMGPMPHLWALESMRFLFEQLKTQPPGKGLEDDNAGDLWKVSMELAESAQSLGMIQFDRTKVNDRMSAQDAAKLFGKLFDLSTDDLQKAARDAYKRNFGALEEKGFNRAIFEKVFAIIMSGDAANVVGGNFESWRTPPSTLGKGVLWRPGFVERWSRLPWRGNWLKKGAAEFWEDAVSPYVEERAGTASPLILGMLFGAPVGVAAIVLARLAFTALHLRGSPARAPNESWLRYVINRSNYIVVPTLISIASLFTAGLFLAQSDLSVQDARNAAGIMFLIHSAFNILTPLANRLLGLDLRKGSLGADPSPGSSAQLDEMRDIIAKLTQMSDAELLNADARVPLVRRIDQLRDQIKSRPDFAAFRESFMENDVLVMMNSNLWDSSNPDSGFIVTQTGRLTKKYPFGSRLSLWPVVHELTLNLSQKNTGGSGVVLVHPVVVDGRRNLRVLSLDLGPQGVPDIAAAVDKRKGIDSGLQSVIKNVDDFQIHSNGRSWSKSDGLVRENSSVRPGNGTVMIGRLYDTGGSLGERGRFVRRITALEGDGLSGTDMRRLEEHALGVLSVNAFLEGLPEMMEGGAYKNGAYALGVSDRHGSYSALSDVGGLKPDLAAYFDPELKVDRTGPVHLNLIQKLAENRKLTVFFVPSRETVNALNDSDARKYREMMAWYLAEPARMENVYFVFGAYDALDWDAMSSEGDVTDRNDRRRMMVEIFKEYVQTSASRAAVPEAVSSEAGQVSVPFAAGLGAAVLGGAAAFFAGAGILAALGAFAVLGTAVYFAAGLMSRGRAEFNTPLIEETVWTRNGITVKEAASTAGSGSFPAIDYNIRAMSVDRGKANQFKIDSVFGRFFRDFQSRSASDALSKSLAITVRIDLDARIVDIELIDKRNADVKLVQEMAAALSAPALEGFTVRSESVISARAAVGLWKQLNMQMYEAVIRDSVFATPDDSGLFRFPGQEPMSSEQFFEVNGDRMKAADAYPYGIAIIKMSGTLGAGSRLTSRGASEEGSAAVSFAAGLGVAAVGIVISIMAGAGAAVAAGSIVSILLGTAAYFAAEYFGAVRPKVSAEALPQFVREVRADLPSDAVEAMDEVLLAAEQRRPVRVEDRVAEIQAGAALFQRTDTNARHQSTMKLIAFWALFSGKSPNGISDQGKVADGQLGRVIQFQSSREMGSVLQDFEALAQLKRYDAQRFSRSLGVSAWDYFYYGGMQSALDESRAFGPDAAIEAYQSLRGRLEPGYAMSRGRKDVAKRIWSQGQKAVSAMGALQPVDVEFDAGLAKEYKQSGPSQVLLHKIHHMAETELSILAKNILRQENSIGRGSLGEESRNLFLLDTGKLNLSRDALLEALEKYGVTPEMFDKVFRKEFLNYTIDDSELLGAQHNLSPGIKRDTGALYGIVIKRARRVGPDPLVRNVSMDIYTDEMIYGESWQQSLKVRIMLIVSQTQIVIFSQSLNATLRESDIVAMQQ